MSKRKNIVKPVEPIKTPDVNQDEVKHTEPVETTEGVIGDIENIVDDVKTVEETKTETVISTPVINEENIMPAFPPEETVVEQKELPKVDENVVVVKPEPVVIKKEEVVIKKEVEPVKPILQENILIPVKIKRENGILLFKGYMKVQDIINNLSKSEETIAYVNSKGIYDIILSILPKIRKDRVIVK